MRNVSESTPKAPAQKAPATGNWRYGLAGLFFGLVLVKSELISWFRIQEMFRFDAFHMYGVIGTAVTVGLISVRLIKRLGVKTIDGQPIRIAPKEFTTGTVVGSVLFGMGWAITGACPGPLFAHVGAGYSVMAVTLLSALVGTWVYGWLRPRLPH